MTGVSGVVKGGRQARRWLAARLVATAVLMTAGFAAIAHKAYEVQIKDGRRLRALGEAQYLHELELPAPRGAVLDRNGATLATSVDVPSIFANPREVVDAESAAHELAPILGLDEQDLADKLGSGKRFAWLKRRVTPEEAKAVQALALPGVGLTPEPKRIYPGGALAGPLLGFAGLDGKGLDGVELSLDDRLSGERANVPVLRDAKGGLLLHDGWEADDERANQGDTVVLTIDRVIQHITERALADCVAENKAKFGVAVVIDAKTGDVLAMASMPTYDPNDPGKHDGARNRPVTDAYEPGSSMKIFTVSTALEDGVVTPDEEFPVYGGQYRVGPKVIRDTHFDKPYLSVGEIIKISSNVGAAQIARKLGKEKLAEGLRRFGFGEPTGIELPGERAGKIRDTKTWGEIGLATAGFGYGMTVSPLQLAAAMAAVANGGVWRAPHIVAEVRDSDGTVVWRPARREHRAVGEKTASAVLAMMQTVMEKGGTGQKIKVPGFLVAGKTGTAKKLDPVTKKYTANKYLASFSAIVPADDPRLIIVIMIDEPSGKAYYGGDVAGPAFSRIASESLKYLGVAPNQPIEEPKAKGKDKAEPPKADKPEEVGGIDDAPDLDSDGVSGGADDAALAGDDLADLPPAGPGEDIVVIPDFSGMSVGQAVRAARAAGVKIDIEGSGRAITQFPPAGRAVKSIRCRITFDPG
jgi:cell division protein FtsI (penicillin-binding protein 3)